MSSWHARRTHEINVNVRQGLRSHAGVLMSHDIKPGRRFPHWLDFHVVIRQLKGGSVSTTSKQGSIEFSVRMYAMSSVLYLLRRRIHFFKAESSAGRRPPIVTLVKLLRFNKSQRCVFYTFSIPFLYLFYTFSIT
jgi:hypothetical protein